MTAIGHCALQQTLRLPQQVLPVRLVPKVLPQVKELRGLPGRRSIGRLIQQFTDRRIESFCNTCQKLDPTFVTVFDRNVITR